MDGLFSSDIDDIPISMTKYTNLIEKIKKNKIFIDLLKLNHSILEIETMCDDVIYDMFKKYMVSDKENISSQSENIPTPSLNKTNNINLTNIPTTSLNKTNNINLTNTLITQNYNKAEKYIKNMLTLQHLIIVNGRINKIPLKILVNTASTYNFIYKNKLVEAKLDNMIDLNLKNNNMITNSNANIYGTIWYSEIDIQLRQNKEYYDYITFPINLIVLEDNKTSTKTANINKSYNTNFDMIIGMNFIKYYGLIINFTRNTLEMNNNIIIEFD